MNCHFIRSKNYINIRKMRKKGKKNLALSRFVIEKNNSLQKDMYLHISKAMVIV